MKPSLAFLLALVLIPAAAASATITMPTSSPVFPMPGPPSHVIAMPPTGPAIAMPASPSRIIAMPAGAVHPITLPPGLVAHALTPGAALAPAAGALVPSLTIIGGDGSSTVIDLR